ncbi:MAG: polyamine ABC transporter substrate-binding protein [Pseudorhodoplanes sp.]
MNDDKNLRRLIDLHDKGAIDRRGFMLGGAALAGMSGAGLLASPAQAQAKKFAGRDVVFTSWGGAYQNAQKLCVCDPFAAKTGANVLQDGPIDEGKLRVMVESKRPVWDVCDVTLTFYNTGVKQGLFEKLDFSKIKTDGVAPQYIGEYGVGMIAVSYNVASNTTMFPQGKHPKTWADLFDLKNFPGQRSLIKRPVPVLEIALLADGVPADKLYPLDVDRAFKKLDIIKKQTIFWESFSQSQQLLTDGQASCGMINNGRAYDAVQKGAKMAIEWHQSLQNVSYWVIPKGSKNVEVAHGLIEEGTVAENQAKLANTIGYAPTNAKAFSGVEQKVLPWLTTYPENLKTAVPLNGAYWAENERAVTERWNSWLLS